MKKMQSNNNSTYHDDEIDLKELFIVLWQEKWIIFSFTSFISIVAIIYSLSLPNIFESKAILTPVNSSTGISNALKSYSGLAGLAGISINSDSDNSNTSQAIAKLGSLSFFEQNILPNIFLPDLMAVSSWDPKMNTLKYDESIYNKTTNTWVKDYPASDKSMPTPQESFEVFTKYFQLIEDSKSNFITFSIKHHSPFIAKEWVELIFNQINLFYREKDKSESNKAISYLNQQITITNLTEINQAISQLLKEETKKLALIEANQNYVFDYIDPPAVMERKSEPRRSAISILGALIGGILSIFYVLFKHYIYGRRAL